MNNKNLKKSEAAGWWPFGQQIKQFPGKQAPEQSNEQNIKSFHQSMNNLIYIYDEKYKQIYKELEKMRNNVYAGYKIDFKTIDNELKNKLILYRNNLINIAGRIKIILDFWKSKIRYSKLSNKIIKSNIEKQYKILEAQSENAQQEAINAIENYYTKFFESLKITNIGGEDTNLNDLVNQDVTTFWNKNIMPKIQEYSERYKTQDQTNKYTVKTPPQMTNEDINILKNIYNNGNLENNKNKLKILIQKFDPNFKKSRKKSARASLFVLNKIPKTWF